MMTKASIVEPYEYLVALLKWCGDIETTDKHVIQRKDTIQLAVDTLDVLETAQPLEDNGNIGGRRVPISRTKGGREAQQVLH
jgi:hypothetical protein